MHATFSEKVASNLAGMEFATHMLDDVVRFFIFCLTGLENRDR